MPIIQLKPEHSHNKIKSVSLTQNKRSLKDSLSTANQSLNNNVHNQLANINQQRLINSQKGILEQSKDTTKDNQTSRLKNELEKGEQKKKRKQKDLNVEIVKKQPLGNHNVKNKALSKQIEQQDPNKKKSKKKKNKRKLIPIEEIPPEMKLKMRTQQLYSQFAQRYRLPYNSFHPQLMNLLKQSFTPFAVDEIDEQNKLLESGEEGDKFNRVQMHNEVLLDEMKKRKIFHEDRIYFGVLEENLLFNDLIWRKEIHSEPKKDQVAMLFNEIHMLVINDVWDGQYEIREKEKPSKDEIIYGSYKANQIRMAENIIKQKLSNLNDEFTIKVEEQQQEAMKFNNYKRFDLNSEETRKAEEFVKKLHEEEKVVKEKARKIKEQQEEQLLVKMEQQRQQYKRLQQEKIQQRRVKLLEKAEERQRQKKYRQEQQKQYEQYLAQHRQKTPLFKKKQEDFRAFLIKEHIKKLQAMKQIQKNKRSISKDQIQIHQVKYRQLKDLLEQQRQEMMRLKRLQAQDRQVTFYKGKFHESVMSQIDTKTIMQQKRSKAEQLYTKKVQYATIVKNNFVPKVDERKKQQLQRLIKDLAPKQKDDKQIAEKTKMQGISNLQKLHRLMAEMRAKGKIKKASTPQSMVEPEIKKSRYTNYLNELKTSRMMNSSLMRRSRFTSLDVSKLNRNSLDIVELQAKNLQQSADRKSLFLRNTKNLDMEEYLQRKFELEDQYIESAKAKLQVLNKYTMED